MTRACVDLTALADRYQTDKGSLDGDRHLYTELYAACFESFRLEKFDLLEMGLLRAPNRAQEADPARRKVQRIPSVDMWLEFFPNAHITGFDLADFTAFEKPRFTFRRGDLSRDEDIERLANSVSSPRIIIDDASHAAFHQQRAFLKLFPVLEPGGFYVIEDLHYAPPFEPDLPPCRKMADIVADYLDTGTLTLDFGAPDHMNALARQIAHVFFHCSARGRPDWGPKLVIFQKALHKPATSSTLRETLDADWLTSRYFQFSGTAPDRIIAARLRFERNGRITGHRNPNEAAWQIEQDHLLIRRADGTPSCRATPQREPDGTITLAGPLIGSGQVLHRFAELPATGPLAELCSFDLFDTLVARRCQDPLAIFRAVETQSGALHFARLRQRVETRLWRAGDYDFDDIYRALGAATQWPGVAMEYLRTLELAEEWRNLFPIAEMVARVGPNDLIVSDMYLPAKFLRRVVDEKCALPGRAIHLSSHGKSRGEIWPELQATHTIRRHHGDNLASDVTGPRRAGIEAEHITLAARTRGETILHEAGLTDFAALVREARLSHHEPDPLLAAAARAQFELNLPLLILASLDVLRLAETRHIDTLLMCTRDCNLWAQLMRVMARLSPAAPAVRTLTSSRVLLLSGSPTYRAYVDHMSGARNLIVDVSGTGRSPAHFIAASGKQQSCFIYLLAGGNVVPPYFAELAPPRTDVDTTMLTLLPNEQRMVIESLNMSLDDRAMRMAFDGAAFTPEGEPNEFGPQARALIAAMRRAFLSSLPFLDTAKLPLSHDHATDAVNQLLALAADFQPLTAPIRQDIARHEKSIAAAARAEQATHN